MRRGLDDIEGFSHPILIYVLNRGHRVDLRPVPFLDDRAHGIFATRNPRRPNPLGLTAPIAHKDAVLARDRAREATKKQQRLEKERDGGPIR